MANDVVCQDWSAKFAWYSNGTLPANEQAQFEEHLASCSNCRQELVLWQDLATVVRAVDGQIQPVSSFASAWNEMAKLIQSEDTPQAQQATRPRVSHSATVQGALLHGLALFIRQFRILPRNIWLITALFNLIACIFILSIKASPFEVRATILAFCSTLSAASSITFMHGNRYDHAAELTQATPTSLRFIMLLRFLLVVGYNMLLAGCISVLIALVYGGNLTSIILMWFGPVMLVAALTLALSMLVSSGLALLGSLCVELAQAIDISLQHNIPLITRIHLNSVWQTNPAMLLGALLCVAVAILLTPRIVQPSDE
ncbi:anti-sigma factor family protein [Ktedonosporobacter rubrisoli]|nr:zf-HC2 domain-containing protein [Ktedonosporobacter rubrisoli]